jgi:CRISPR system Cascade subunit CasB
MDDPFVERLKELFKAKDTGAMAALRRGLGKPPGSAAEMHRYVVPFLSARQSPRDDDSLYLLASLFAFWHQGKKKAPDDSPENIGASLSTLRDESDSIEKRFVALLNSHVDDLPNHLRHAIGLLKGKDVAVNWTKLLRDLRGWDHDARYVQRAWARGFWRAPPEDAALSGETASQTPMP